MTEQEFLAAFEIVAPVYVPDRMQRIAVYAYCCAHFEEIERIQEIYQLTSYIQDVMQVIKSAVSFAGLVLSCPPLFTISVNIPTASINQELIATLNEAIDDFPEFFVQFLVERGVDLIELHSRPDIQSPEDLSRFQKIINQLDEINLGNDDQTGEGKDSIFDN